MNFHFIISLLIISAVLADTVPVEKNLGGKFHDDTLGITMIVTDKYYMTHTNFMGMIDMSIVYNSESTVGDKSTTYKPTTLNMDLGGIANNDLVKKQFKEFGCPTPDGSIISYKWVSEKCKKAMDDFDVSETPEVLVLAKQQQSDSVAYQIKDGAISTEKFQLSENSQLNNEVENTLKPDGSSRIIPALMIVIITLAVLML